MNGNSENHKNGAKLCKLNYKQKEKPLSKQPKNRDEKLMVCRWISVYEDIQTRCLVNLGLFFVE